MAKGKETKGKEAKGKEATATGNICPIHFMGTSNGLYYFYGMDCANGGQWVGAQDTEPHTLGQGCPIATNCTDPIKGLRKFHEHGVPSSRLFPRCECGDKARDEGLASPITFDHPFIHNHPSGLYVWERGFRSVASYTDDRGRPRLVRLLHLEMGIYPLALVTFQVGQECCAVPEGLTPISLDPPVHEDGCYHVIKVTGTDGEDRYYDVIVCRHPS